MNASNDDKQVLVFDVPDAAFGYHAQQAVEKLYKALIASHGLAYPFIHDLVALRGLLEKSGEALPDFAANLERLTSFAGQSRYEQPIHLDAAQRGHVRVWIDMLMTFCVERIDVLGKLPELSGTRGL